MLRCPGNDRATVQHHPGDLAPRSIEAAPEMLLDGGVSGPRPPRFSTEATDTI